MSCGDREIIGFTGTFINRRELLPVESKGLSKIGSQLRDSKIQPNRVKDYNSGSLSVLETLCFLFWDSTESPCSGSSLQLIPLCPVGTHRNWKILVSHDLGLNLILLFDLPFGPRLHHDILTNGLPPSPLLDFQPTNIIFDLLGFSWVNHIISLGLVIVM